MAKTPGNQGKDWTAEHVKELKSLAVANTPTRVIGLKLGRSVGSVTSKASEIGLSLKRTNQSSRGTKKK
jgi:hypothetical protein